MPATEYQPKEYPKLASGVVDAIYKSPFKRSWIADHHQIPRRLVTKIKQARSWQEAVERYGH